MNTNNTHNTPRDNDEISLKELILESQEWWRYLLSKWLIILIAGFVGGGLGLIYSLQKEPVYIAETTFVLEEPNGGGGLGQYSGLAAAAGIDLGGSGGGIFQGNNIIELYKSRSMIEKALLTEVENGKTELLIDQYITFNKLRDQWAGKNELANIQFHLKPHESFTRVQDSLLGSIINNIRTNNLTVTKPDQLLSIIKVGVKSQDEAFAKNFNNQIVKTVNDFYIQTKTKKFLENIKILQHQTDSVRQDLGRAIYSGAQALDATPNLNIARQSNRNIPVQKAQIATELNSAILGELIKNLELAKISLLKVTPLIQIIDQPVYPLKKDRLRKITGILLGGFLAGFLTLFTLLIRRIFNNILS